MSGGTPKEIETPQGEGEKIMAHVDYPHHPGTLYDCPSCEWLMEKEAEKRQIRYLRAKERTQHRNTHAARASLAEARIAIEAHGERVPDDWPDPYEFQ